MEEIEEKKQTENACTTTFANVGKFDPSALNPSKSITSNFKPKTLDVQRLSSQNEMIKVNKYIANQASFPKFASFVDFPNISLGEKYEGPTSNSFFDAFFLAYALHGQIVLSPDDIWLQICSEFSKYVNFNAAKLRNKIVTHDGKKELVVLYNETDPSFQDFKSPTFRWDSILQSFSDLITKNTIGGIGPILQNNFSTTGPIEQISGQACLMHACEKYFNYKMGICGCGIEKVHFLGKKEDWEAIKEKTLKLKTYDCDGYLAQWIERLEPTLSSFIESYDGEEMRDFWNSIVHKFVGYVYEAGASVMGGHYVPYDFINGWLLDFFIYNKYDSYMEDCKGNYSTEEPEKIYKNKQERDEYVKNRKKMLQGVKFNLFPSSFVKIPVLIEYMYGPKKGQQVPVHFATGFSGVLVKNDWYRPQISFAVADRKPSDEEAQKKMQNSYDDDSD